MPRIIRRQSESKIYHIMVRGNERKNLFIDDEDKVRFIDTLYRLAGYVEGKENPQHTLSPAFSVKKEKKLYIYAYCLMNNHVHLLINEGEDSISRIMKRIGSSYVYYFNRKYGRVGHLFQDRFKSEAVEDDAYLLAAARYIHNNPVKACMVEHPSQYLWSSYNEYMGQARIKRIADTDYILGMYSGDRERSVELFTEYTDQQSEYEFIEYQEVEENKTLINVKDAMDFIEGYLKDEGIELSEINNNEKSGARNELIRELRERSNLSVRQIAGILGVNRGVVQRVRP